MTQLETRQGKSKPRTFRFGKKQRQYCCCGIGSFPTSFGAKTVQCDTELGGDLASAIIGFDSNIVSVERSIAQVRRFAPNFRWRLRHPLNFDLCRVHMVNLESNEYRFGFNRSLSAPLAYTKVIHRTIDEILTRVNRDRRALLHVPVQFVPVSTSGAHALVPQQLLNYKLHHLSSPQFRVGLVATPEENDVASVQNFKQIFPLVINQHGFFDCFVIWSNGLWNGARNVHQQDLLVARTILGAVYAFRHDTSAPSIGDVLETLKVESNVIGASACEYPLQLKRRFADPFHKFADSGQVVESMVNGIKRVVNDPDTNLIEAKPSPRPQYIVVTGRFTTRDFSAALDQVMLPAATKVLAAPSSASTLTVGRLFPVDGCIKSIEKFWDLKRNRVKNRNNRYSLPSDIVRDSIKKTMPILRKLADYLHVSPEQLVSPGKYGELLEEETLVAEKDEGTVTIKQEGVSG